MNALYEAFLPAMRAESGDLEAKHTSEKSLVDHVRRGHDGERRRHEQRGAFPFVRDQVMQTHPVTGKKIVFVNDLLTTALHGPSRREGRALLSRLTDLTRGPAHQGRYRWEPDTIVTWDNRSVQHYAATDYAPSRCRLQRVTVAGPSASFVALGGAG